MEGGEIMEIGYILAVIFALIFIGFKIAEMVKKYKAEQIAKEKAKNSYDK